MQMQKFIELSYLTDFACLVNGESVYDALRQECIIFSSFAKLHSTQYKYDKCPEFVWW